MMTIATAQHRNARRRSSSGHSGARSDTPRAPQRKSLPSISAPPLGRNDPLSHRIGVDQCARSTCYNSPTASAALKSP
jgi:hypothetical protein